MTDPINAIDALVGRLLHGPMHKFTFTEEAGHSGYDVERLLQQYHIRCWGRAAQGKECSLLVKRRQAAWAEYLLCRAGVPLTGKLLNLAHRGKAGKMPPPWTRHGVGPKTFVDYVVRFAGFLLGQ